MMNRRCENLHDKRYGGRGIKVCPQWRRPFGFIQFLADVGIRPAGTSIGRFGDEGNYEPGNCKWMTQAEQLANRRKPNAVPKA